MFPAVALTSTKVVAAATFERLKGFFGALAALAAAAATFAFSDG
jgi:hypothetical protein